MYKYKDKDIKLCDGATLDGKVKCIHRFRCYRFSLAQDALFKGMDFNKIDVEECLNPTDEEVVPFNSMWLPSDIPNY